MAENRIELKSVGELLGMRFFIPSYQRGYRWGYLQIEALLNDIFDFDEKVDGDFYCLQPLVVRKTDKWRVIDGQQRLTTIYLILRSLSVLYELKTGLFILEYERESYITKCDESNDIIKDNIELYYLTKAKSFINSWIGRLEENEKKDFTQKLLYQTKFIVYNAGLLELNEERNLFNNLNSGKIALTNAELIKALFLNKVDKAVLDYKEDELQLIVHREVEQRLLADEFDYIERTIRQDDFWSFLAGNEEKPSSCVNLLFDLMLEADDKATHKYHKDEKFRTFFYFNDRINGVTKEESNNASKELWKEVRSVFYMMVGWYNDSTMYNLIGYHRAIRPGKSLPSIYKKFKKSNSKSDFKKWLIEECKDRINYPDGFMELRYDEEKDKVFNLLLLFNIISLMNKPQEQVKFNFTSFHANKWDVEHISPQNPKDDDVLINEIMKDKNNKKLDSLRRAIEEKNEDIVKEEKKVFIAEGDELMGLQNLTLLTAHDNRGIGNKFFFEKRNSLQENYKKGSFIPLCSMNVFMKFYSENPNQMLFWDEDDRSDYSNVIKKTIDDFFMKKNNE